MESPNQVQIGILDTEFTQAVANSHHLPNAGQDWQQFFINFLRKLVLEYTNADKPFNPARPGIPHPFVFCLADPVVRGIGSPLSTLDAFVIFKDESVLQAIIQNMQQLNAALMEISRPRNWRASNW